MTNYIGYVSTCVTCQGVGLDRRYEGEIARTLKQRSREHLREVARKDENNGLYKHVKDCHPDKPPTFRFQVRQVFSEGVRIEGVPEETLLNTKNDTAVPVG